MKTLFTMLLFGVIVTAGCSRNDQLKKEAIARLSEVGADVLLSDAEDLWQSSTVTHMEDIPEDQWPDTFRSFSPVQVWRGPTGIYIIMSKFVSKTAGIHISVDPDHKPEDLSNCTNELLHERIYWTLTS